MPSINIDLNEVEELESKIINTMYDNLDLDDLEIDLSKFELSVNYSVIINSIQLEKQEEQEKPK